MATGGDEVSGGDVWAGVWVVSRLPRRRRRRRRRRGGYHHLRHAARRLVGDVAVEERDEVDRDARPHHVERLDADLEVHLLAGHRREEGEPEGREHHHDRLVEDVEHHRRLPPVHVAPLHQQQLAQVAELRERKVGRVGRLHPLLPRDADADVGRLDHRHVVGAVADGERHGALDRVAHQRDDLRLLRRRAPVAATKGDQRLGERKGRLCSGRLCEERRSLRMRRHARRGSRACSGAT